MPALKDEFAAIHPATEDTSAAGWDPGRVWRDRVQTPRLAHDLQQVEVANAENASEGWDPFQTWQYRVLRLPVPDRDA